MAYTLGWLHERKGDAAQAATWYRRGRELPPDYCFPFRLEEIAVLERATAHDPQDPRAPYYLGNLLYDLQPERAIAEWEKSRALDPGFARVHRNLAFAYARARGDLAQAAASQEKAVAIEKREPRLYYELDQYLAWTKAPLSTRLARLTESPETVASREITAGRLARVQVLLGRDDDALDTLSGTRFHVWEGESGIHSVYVAARLERGRRLLAKGDAAAALDEFRATVDVPANIEVGQGVGRAPRRRAPPRRPRAREARPQGRGGGRLPGVRERPRGGRRGPLLDRPVARRSSAARSRPAATSSGSRRPSRARWTPRDRSRCGWRRREGRSADFHARALGLLGLGRQAEARTALASALDADPDNVAPSSSTARSPPTGRAAARRARPARARPWLPPPPPVPVRVAGLDAYRGLVLALMMGEALHFCGVSAAFPASALWAFLCHHQDHVAWIGCSLHDLIQPGFSFLVGRGAALLARRPRRARPVPRAR